MSHITVVSPEVINRLLNGAIDLHCHSGPSVMPRYCDHIEAMREASAAGISTLLLKDHYYSAAPIANLLNKHFANMNVTLLSGVPLNNVSGGFNPYAVEHGIRLGAKLVWMPTQSSKNHIDHHKKDAEFNKKFPQTKSKMLEPVPLTVLDTQGQLLPEVLTILDLIAQHDVVLSAGHLHISEIWPLFTEAKKRGVHRLLVNHPTYLIDASLHDIFRLVCEFGAYMEHSMCMWTPDSKFKFYEPEFLSQLIQAAGVDHTILGSDLGQTGNPGIVEGFRTVICICLKLGYNETDIRKMISGNASKLMNLPV